MVEAAGAGELAGGAGRVGGTAARIDCPRARSSCWPSSQAVAERCVLGADIDARAVAVTRHALEDFVGVRVPALRANIRAGDALALTWPPLDAMVGNPPCGDPSF